MILTCCNQILLEIVLQEIFRKMCSGKGSMSGTKPVLRWHTRLEKVRGTALLSWKSSSACLRSTEELSRVNHLAIVVGKEAYLD